MTKYRDILKVVACGLLTAGLTACSDLFMDNVVDCGSEEVATSSSYIQLSLSQASSSGTRSADNPPKGGEWGDGREIGQDYENVVTTVAIFLYQDENGVNGDATTQVTMVYFGQGEVSGQQNKERYIDYIATTTAKEVDLKPGEYNVLAIANPSSVEWALQKGDELTLGDVRDHIEKSAWTETTTDGVTTYSSFLMTSENEGNGVTLTYNTKENPAVAEVYVERMAARVDYQANGTFTITNEDVDGNETGTGDPTYEGAKVEITGAALVNNLTAGSYELKRTNAGYESTTVTYLGSETADETTSVATNYVIDPWTNEKNGGSSVTIDGQTSDVSNLYGVYYPGYATDGDEQNPSYWAGLVTAGTAVTYDDGTTWNIVGYTMENTTYADYTDKKYNTGVVFAATFTPADVTVRNSFYTGYNFVYGTSTFFKWNNILYATAEDMMAVAYPNVFTTENMFGEETFTSITDLDELATFIATLRDDDPTGYKAYLQSIEEFPTSGSSSLYWETYMENECGYKFDTTEGVIINAFNGQSTTSTRAVLAAATDGAVNTYENSQCYYTWWIRHSNDDTEEHDGDATNGIMEYAIVRNNIYKLQVSSVYSIGGDIPEEGLRIHVYVKNWTMLDVETIYL